MFPMNWNKLKLWTAEDKLMNAEYLFRDPCLRADHEKRKCMSSTMNRTKQSKIIKITRVTSEWWIDDFVHARADLHREKMHTFHHELKRLKWNYEDHEGNYGVGVGREGRPCIWLLSSQVFYTKIKLSKRKRSHINR